jgi:hypothetical protein
MLWWEAVPAENVIVHPLLVLTDLYHTEYLPYIQSYGQAPPLSSSRMSKAAPSASGKVVGQPPGGSFRARKEALKAVSIEWTGLDPATGEPKTMLKLQSRPDHSMYAECDDCAALRKRYEAALKARQGAAARHAVRADLIRHVQDTFAERRVVAAERKAAHNSTDTVFAVDDKLGSWWQFLPMAQHERVEKGTTDNWCYKACLQGNFWPGVGNHYAVVPPMLRTGANFGCTSFVTSLYHLIKGGKIGAGVKRCARQQTDGGSDNVGWVTYVLNVVLVREGVFDIIDWLRLRAGHSHNEGDGNHSTARRVFYPKKGVGPGCASPFQFEQMLVDGLRGMSGGLEMLWQLSNYNFSKWAEGLVQDLGGIKNQRWWRFVYDPKWRSTALSVSLSRSA